MLPKVKEAIWQSFFDERFLMIEASSMIADSNAVSCRSRWSVVINEIVVIGSGCVPSREAEDSYQGMRLRTVGTPNGL